MPISAPENIRRFAFKMKLKPGKVAEYRKRHDALWPALADLLKENGIHEYSIFLDAATNTLFAFQKISGSQGSQDLGQHPVVKEWWAYMADIMEINADQSPITIPLDEVFYLP